LPTHALSSLCHRKRVSRLSVQKGLPQNEAAELLAVGLAAALSAVQILPHAAYAPLEDEARWRILHDPNDWPCVALGLRLLLRNLDE
jgi:PIN domain